MSDRRFEGRIAAIKATRASQRKVGFLDKNQELQLNAKFSYLRGLVWSKGWKIKTDDNSVMFVHILDQAGEDLSGPKTIQAAIDFVEAEIEKGR